MCSQSYTCCPGANPNISWSDIRGAKPKWYFWCLVVINTRRRVGVEKNKKYNCIGSEWEEKKIFVWPKMSYRERCFSIGCRPVCVCAAKHWITCTFAASPAEGKTKSYVMLRPTLRGEDRMVLWNIHSHGHVNTNRHVHTHIMTVCLPHFSVYPSVCQWHVFFFNELMLCGLCDCNLVFLRKCVCDSFSFFVRPHMSLSCRTVCVTGSRSTHSCLNPTSCWLLRGDSPVK